MYNFITTALRTSYPTICISSSSLVLHSHPTVPLSTWNNVSNWLQRVVHFQHFVSAEIGFSFFPRAPTLDNRADFSVSWAFLQTVGLLERAISPSQGLYLSTGQHKQNKRIYTPNMHVLCGIQTHDPGYRASERRQYIPWTARLPWPAGIELSLRNLTTPFELQR
jgi:hypothetical protein